MNTKVINHFKRKLKSLFFTSDQSRSKVGKDCSVDSSSKLVETTLGGNVFIGPECQLVKSKLTGKISLEKNCKFDNALLAGDITFGQNSKILDGVALYGNINIGKFTTLNGPNTDLRSAIYPIHIGNFCSIARNVVFQEYNHDFTQLTSYMVNTNLKGKSYKNDIISKGAIRVEHDVWIGTHCVILSGVTIGTGAVIAANSVVARDIPPYAIASGSPARVIKYRFSEEKIEELLKSEWWHKSKEEVIELFNKFKR